MSKRKGGIRKYSRQIGLAAILLAGLALILPSLLQPAPAEPDFFQKETPPRQTQPKKKRQRRSLTDVAPAQRHVDAQFRDVSTLDLDPLPQADIIYPEDADPDDMPAWTKTLAKPKVNPVPPDPFVEPPVKVDPRRVKE
ncbi:MAG: hypothetical protein QNK37_19670 [Acidobacteriota bacterium]|nr:hypothetical protein [Acidobacteriota bacterium]